MGGGEGREYPSPSPGAWSEPASPPPPSSPLAAEASVAGPAKRIHIVSAPGGAQHVAQRPEIQQVEDYDDDDEQHAPPSPPPVPRSKFSRLRPLQVQPLKTSPDSPSPPVWGGGTAMSPIPYDVTKVQATSAKRKTLLERAIEGWWDLPGLLTRADTIRGKTKPFPSSRR
ncbi:hypothetical protein VTK73DRAFT_3897 [Phialemonium thermophilum]|uniref:Uncharacterized protein n=1 Tax=Phialemonium thermophilum TaxID=223376 RepID=A0ABR3WW94_9PEZI